MHRKPRLIATILTDAYALIQSVVNQLGPDANNEIIAGLPTDAILNADYIPFRDTAEKVLKRISWVNIVNTLITVFDARYTSSTPMTGVKVTGTDAGVIGQTSITDDYLYICVQTGTTSTAIWKKITLFQSI
jgi:hypothetical protein